jgi:hypothetical protein
MRHALLLLSLCLVGYGCAARKTTPGADPPSRWQSAEVVPFQTSTGTVVGLDGPAEPYGRELASKIAEALTGEGIPATVVATPSPNPGKLIVEGRFLELDAGNRAARWAAGIFGAGAVRIAVEGRASGDQLPSPAFFNVSDKGRFGAFGGDWREIVNDCFEIIAADIASMVASREFDGVTRSDLAEALDAARTAPPAPQQQSTPAIAKKDTETRLADLKRMYDTKIITREEYEAQRNRILGEL